MGGVGGGGGTGGKSVNTGGAGGSGGGGGKEGCISETAGADGGKGGTIWLIVINDISTKPVIQVIFFILFFDRMQPGNNSISKFNMFEKRHKKTPGMYQG